MLLAMAGLGLILIFMFIVMTKRMSAMVALIFIPVVFAVVLGFQPDALGKMMLDGVKKVAPTGIMIGFAMMYFSTMIDTGMFDPIIRTIQKATKGDPARIILGSSVLATLVALDGDGATTYMVTCTAMLSFYKRLKLNPLILPTVALIPASIMNMTPWGGPTGRVISALQLEVADIFLPLIPAMIVGILFTWGVAFWMGVKERKRIGYVANSENAALDFQEVTMGEDNNLKRPKLLWFNFLLTILLLIGLSIEILPLGPLFMIATAIALIVNYPNVKIQQERVSAHAPNALPVMGMIFAAGIFTGILGGTKMLESMSTILVSVIPESMGSHLAFITAFLSLPATYFLTNDAFYFGILPVLVETGANYGVSPASLGIASLVGQGAHLLSPMVASTYLLVGLAGVEYGEFQKFALPWAMAASLVMLVVVIILGYVPI